MIRLLPILCVFWLLTPPAVAQNWDAGLKAYQQGNYLRALQEWRTLAEQGHVLAQYNIGLMYIKGEGIPQDYAEALKWFGLAAEEGNSGAQYMLGFMHFHGQGVAQDDAEAEKWYRLAAEQGDPTAQTALGTLFAKGWGVPKDLIEAHMWLNIAASWGDKTAIRLRDWVAEQMTADQVAEAQKLAREWRQKR